MCAPPSRLRASHQQSVVRSGALSSGFPTHSWFWNDWDALRQSLPAPRRGAASAAPSLPLCEDSRQGTTSSRAFTGPTSKIVILSAAKDLLFSRPAHNLRASFRQRGRGTPACGQLFPRRTKALQLARGFRAHASGKQGLVKVDPGPWRLEVHRSRLVHHPRIGCTCCFLSQLPIPTFFLLLAHFFS